MYYYIGQDVILNPKYEDLSIAKCYFLKNRILTVKMIDSDNLIFFRSYKYVTINKDYFLPVFHLNQKIYLVGGSSVIFMNNVSDQNTSILEYQVLTSNGGLVEINSDLIDYEKTMEEVRRDMENQIVTVYNRTGSEDLPLDVVASSNQYFKCDECGCWYNKDVLHDDSDIDELICGGCFDEIYAYCEECGKTHRIDEMQEIDDKLICEDCFDDLYITCDDCGCNLRRDNAYETSDCRHICSICKEVKYEYCYDCGDLYHTDDLEYDGDNGQYYCEDCYNDRNCSVIDGYHDNCFDCSDLVYLFNENESIPLGFELEAEGNKSTAREVKDSLYNKFTGVKNFLFFEYDSSLDDGYETKTLPCTMPFLYANKDNIKEMLDIMKGYGMRSHNTSTCGLHVHRDRESLKTPNRTIDEVIDNIIIVIEVYKKQIFKIARRGNEHYCRYCTADENEQNITSNKIKKLKGSEGRYSALNLENSDTIEFRMFKGTLKFESLMAAIELTDAIIDVCRFEDLENITWDMIINRKPHYNYEYRYLKEYAKERDALNATYEIKDMINKEKQLQVKLEQLEKEYKIISKEQCSNMGKGDLVLLRSYEEMQEIINKINYSSLNSEYSFCGCNAYYDNNKVFNWGNYTFVTGDYDDDRVSVIWHHMCSEIVSRLIIKKVIKAEQVSAFFNKEEK